MKPLLELNPWSEIQSERGLSSPAVWRPAAEGRNRASPGRQPLALLMDEPLSNLDDELKFELCDQLLDLHSQVGFTLVYVTHRKEEMTRIGTRAILLRDGKEVLA